jgi:GxxExxY protein
MTENEIAEVVVEAAFRVHRELGPGLLENAYLHCLAFEIAELGVQSEMQVPLPLVYRDVKLDAGYRLDLWVDRKLIVEVKAVDMLHPVHSAQLITYLKLTGNRLGLLINFNEKFLKNGLRRIANGMPS